MITIAAKDILNLRLKLQLSQEEFAREVGVTLSTIYRWEAGKSIPSKLAKLRLVELREEYSV